MPESVQDRPTRSHEQVFLFAKQPHYYFDATAIKDAACMTPQRRFTPSPMRQGIPGQPDHHGVKALRDVPAMEASSRNARTVWRINPEPLTGFQHYAAFPTELVRRILKAGAPTQVCRQCAAPYVRQVEKTGDIPRRWSGNDTPTFQDNYRRDNGRSTQATYATTGFSPTCHCGAPGDGKAAVFDPFVGSGTVPLVARELGHHGVGLDLSYPYLHDIARERLGLAALHEWTHGAAAVPATFSDLPLFATEDTP